MDPSQSWDRRGPALAVSALILLTAFALPAGSFGQTPRQRTNLDWSGYAVTARSPIRQIRGAWTEPSLTCRQRWSSSALGDLGSLRNAAIYLNDWYRGKVPIRSPGSACLLRFSQCGWLGDWTSRCAK